MLGTDRNTGKPLAGLAHLFQSVTDILTTPLGSRVERPTYGSEVFDLIDSDLTQAGLVNLYHAAASALAAWEPRLQVTQIKARVVQAGSVLIDIIGIYLPDGKPITLQGIVVS
jgi:hypothetical protein